MAWLLKPLLLLGAIGSAMGPVSCQQAGVKTGVNVAQSHSRWLVIAPHPDDEALMASGVLLRAKQSGADVAVIVMTNGDFYCLNDGVQRQGETVTALSVLGVAEDQVYFLGYPDGALAQLGQAPLRPRPRITDHSCTLGNTTYGLRGFGRRDYHSVRFGVPALYTRDHAVSDLAMLLDQLRPTDVVISHPDDTHPDHVATYSLFRSALDRILEELPEAPRVHRAMVHNGDCWPTGDSPKEPCPPGTIEPDSPLPPLSGRLTGYIARERLEVPESCREPDPRTNPKLRAIAAHVSQTHNSFASYLFSFARRDEVFFPEQLVKTGGHFTRMPHVVIGQLIESYAITGVNYPTGTTGNRDPVLGMGSKTSGAFEAPLGNVYQKSLSVPVVVSMNLLPPILTEQGSTARFELLGDESGAYALSLDADRLLATLSRTFAGGASTLLHEWPLPHDFWSGGGAEAVSFAIEPQPDDGPIAVLTLRCRGDIVGVVTDVNPRLQGERLALSNVAAIDGNLTISGTRKSKAVVAAHGPP